MATTPPSPARSSRSACLGLRATPRQEAILRRAADAVHKSLTDFILDSACHAPEQTLLDQRLMVSGSQYSALMDLLDQPPRSNAGLRDLWRALMISDQAGIRALLTHPMDEEAARFYSRFGFEPSPLREDQLLLVLKDARRLVAGDF